MKKGKRTKQLEAQISDLNLSMTKQITEQALADGVSEDVIRERLAELARVRNEMEARYRGTDTEVASITYDNKKNQVVVSVRPRRRGTQEVGPEAKQRTAEFEISKAFGRSHTSLALIVGLK